jgi:hypothetical protein
VLVYTGIPITWIAINIWSAPHEPSPLPPWVNLATRAQGRAPGPGQEGPEIWTPIPLCLHRIGGVLPQFGQPIDFGLQHGCDLFGSGRPGIDLKSGDADRFLMLLP